MYLHLPFHLHLQLFPLHLYINLLLVLSLHPPLHPFLLFRHLLGKTTQIPQFLHEAGWSKIGEQLKKRLRVTVMTILEIGRAHV